MSGACARLSGGGAPRVAALRRAASALTCLLALPGFAQALADHGADLYPREKVEVSLSGYFRARADLLSNLDLDRGLTPSGRPLYAVPLADPQGQTLATADARLRTNLAIYAPYAQVAVKIQADLLDNLVMGSTPVLTPGTGNAPTPATSVSQLPVTLLRIKRAYAEALTPIGLLSAGRMNAHWGLGMLLNGGDCLDCNSSDSADRIAFVTPIASHLWAVAYDFSAVGPLAVRPNGQQSLVLDASTDVRTLTFAVMNVRDDQGRARRRQAGKLTFEYGAFGAYRWQDNDVPASYLPLTSPVQITPSQVVKRGYRAGAFDVWARLTTPTFRAELETALLVASIDQASLIPGVLLRDPGSSTQYGAALELEYGALAARWHFGLNAGFASGDPAPGFGAFPPAGTASTPGELDGPQATWPRDTRVDNFRFSPDYRIDRILFNEIIGTVTDAVYARPWASVRLVDVASAGLLFKLAATGTRALYASSTPGGDAWLGLELHPSLVWESRDGFNALLEYAVLFPFAGLSNPAAGLTAQPAQLLRLRLAFVF